MCIYIYNATPENKSENPNPKLTSSPLRPVRADVGVFCTTSLTGESSGITGFRV